MKIIGSPYLSISADELKSVGKGFLIAIAGAVLTALTHQLTGANFTLQWHEFNIGPFFFAAGAYNATPIVWAGWSAAVNFLRKWIPNTEEVSQQ